MLLVIVDINLIYIWIIVIVCMLEVGVDMLCGVFVLIWVVIGSFCEIYLYFIVLCVMSFGCIICC